MKLDAEALRQCLLLGAIPVEFAIEWADRQVDERDKPHHALLETAMAVGKPPSEVAVCLAEVPGEVDSHEALVHRMFAWMHEALVADPGRASGFRQSLLAMASDNDLESLPEELSEVYSIEDAFEGSAPGGSGDRVEAELQVAEFLARFAIDKLRK